MATPIQKVLSSVGKVGLWLGIDCLTQHLTGNPELAHWMETAGVGISNIDDVCNIVDSLAKKRISDYWKDFRGVSSFGVTQHVQLAFQTALKAAPKLLTREYGKTLVAPLNLYETKQVLAYFQSLSHQLTTHEFPKDLVDQYVYDRSAFITTLLTGPGGNAYVPDLSSEKSEHLANWVTAHFEKKLGLYLYEVFKADDKAKTAYMIQLLEQCAYDSRQTLDKLDILATTLANIATHQQVEMALGRQAIHSLQLLEEHHRKAAVDFRAYREAFDTLDRRVQENAEPSLRLPDYSLTKLGRQHLLDYHLRHTTFVGRQPEMEQLWQFVNSQPDKPFLWWMVTGPGGMGKSRLAFEFCREMRGLSYHVGFLEKSDLNGGFIHGWSHWRPSRPTVLVVDYVAGYSKDVLTMLGELSRSAAAGYLPNRVRVLLLERETRDDWWGGFETDADVSLSRYGTTALPLLDLPHFDRDRLWSIIEEVYRKEGNGKAISADREQTLDKLTELDPDGRPLFAFLVGLALAAHNDIRNWNVDQLLDNLLRRYEEKIWSQFEDYTRIGAAHKNLLMLATLARGIEDGKLDQLYACAPAGSLPTPAINDMLYNRMAHITKNEGGRIIYDGLQPDLVGEYFVLRWLTELLQQRPHGKQLAEKLLETIWTIKTDGVMCLMAIQDFYSFFEFTAIPLLTQTTPPIGLSSTQQYYWAQLHYSLAHPDSKIPYKEPHYEALKSITDKSKDITTALVQATAAYNLINTYGSAGNFVEAEIKYKDLQELAEHFKESSIIAFRQSIGAYNLLNFYGKMGDFINAEMKYVHLRDLVTHFREDISLALRQAKGTNNLIALYCKAGNFVEAETKYDDLQELAEHFKEPSSIAFQQAIGAYNLAIIYSKVGDITKAERKYKHLQKLVEQFERHPSIAMKQAMVAYNMTNYYCNKIDWSAARQKVDDTIKLAGQFNEDEAIGLQAALAVGALLAFSFEGADDISDRPALVALLGQFVQTFQQSSIWEERLSILERTFLESALQDELANGV